MQTQNCIKADIINLFYGTKSIEIGTQLYNLEILNIFEVDDPINHSSYFQNIDLLQPRALFVDFQSNFNECFDQKLIEKNDQSVDIWQGDMQIIPQNSEEDENNEEFEMDKQKDTFKEQQEQIDYKINNTIDENTPVKKKILHNVPRWQINMIRHNSVLDFDNDFCQYHSGINFMQNYEQREGFEDQIRKMLEKSDYHQGIQLFSDCDSGFGLISQHMMNFVQEECIKKPIYFYPIFGRYLKRKNPIQENTQILNEMTTLSSFREDVSIMFPIEFSQNNSFQVELFYKKKNDQMEKTQINLARNIAPSLSNMSISYRQSQKNTDMTSYLYDLKLSKQTIVMNVATDIPCDEQMSVKQFLNKRYSPNFQNLFHKYQLSDSNFSEHFTTRSDLFKEYDGFNHLNINSALALDHQYKDNYSEKINKNYFYVNQDNQKIEGAIPLYTAVVCNSGFSQYLKNLVQDYRKLPNSVKMQFMKSTNIHRDELKEIECDIQTLEDNYYDDVSDDDSL